MKPYFPAVEQKMDASWWCASQYCISGHFWRGRRHTGRVSRLCESSGVVSATIYAQNLAHKTHTRGTLAPPSLCLCPHLSSHPWPNPCDPGGCCPCPYCLLRPFRQDPHTSAGGETGVSRRQGDTNNNLSYLIKLSKQVMGSSGLVRLSAKKNSWNLEIFSVILSYSIYGFMYPMVSWYSYCVLPYTLRTS